MKIRLFIIVCLLAFNTSGISQNLTEMDDLFFENLNLVYKDPEQTLRVAGFLLTNAETDLQKAQGNYLRYKAESLKGNHVASIEAIFKVRSVLNPQQPDYLQGLAAIAISELSRNAGMNDVSVQYLDEAKEIIAALRPSEKTNLTLVNFNFENAAAALYVSNDPEDALKLLLKNKIPVAESRELVPAYSIENNIRVASIYLIENDVKNARLYFNKALSELKTLDLMASSLEATVLAGLGKLSIKEGDFTEASTLLLQAKNISVVPPTQYVEVLGDLSEVYLKIDSLDASRSYNRERSLLNETVINSERNSRNTIISFIKKDREQMISSDLSIYYRVGFILLGVVILGIVIYYFYNRKLDREYKKFEKVIARIEKKEKLETLDVAQDSVPKESKGVVIPEETENAILERLNEFENSDKFTKAGISLQSVAKELNTNTKYISEIIHTHRGKNFNTYINELRVNYIINRMKDDKKYLSYKVSYLAEESGFSSHSAFTVVFKSITGITPNQFITFLKKDTKIPSQSF